MANKVKYGVKSIYYAVAAIAADGSATYETPVAIPGAVSLSMDQSGETSPFYADNITYYTSITNNGYSGSVETALLPESFLKDVMGEIEDGNGVLIENAEAEPVHFALLFQFEGDEKATRHVLYNCTAQRPTISGNTKEDTTSPETEKINITATSIYDATLKKNVVKARTGSATTTEDYDSWFTTVHAPVAPAAG